MSARSLPSALLVGLALLGGVACSEPYPENGSCSRSADCKQCIVCGCPRAYSTADVGSTCEEIQAATKCEDEQAGTCPTGAVQTLCVSGACRVVNR